MRTETTPNIYGTNAGNSQHSENGIPLHERSNNPVGRTVAEQPTPVSSASAPPIYSVVRRNRPGNVVVQSERSAPAFLCTPPCSVSVKVKFR